MHWLRCVLRLHNHVDCEDWDDNPGDLFWIGQLASNSQLVMWASAHYSMPFWNSNIFTDFIDVGGQLVQANCSEYVPFVSFCATGEDMYFKRFLQLSWWATWDFEKVAAPRTPLLWLLCIQQHPTSAADWTGTTEPTHSDVDVSGQR